MSCEAHSHEGQDDSKQDIGEPVPVRRPVSKRKPADGNKAPMSRPGAFCESSGYYRDDAEDDQSQAPEIEPEVFPRTLAAVAADRAIDGLLFYGMAAVRAVGGEHLFRLHRGLISASFLRGKPVYYRGKADYEGLREDFQSFIRGV